MPSRRHSVASATRNSVTGERKKREWPSRSQIARATGKLAGICMSLAGNRSSGEWRVYRMKLLIYCAFARSIQVFSAPQRSRTPALLYSGEENLSATERYEISLIHGGDSNAFLSAIKGHEGKHPGQHFVPAVRGMKKQMNALIVGFLIILLATPLLTRAILGSFVPYVIVLVDLVCAIVLVIVYGRSPRGV